MSNESVIVEETLVTEVPEVDELEGFNYENYVQYLPSDVTEKATALLQEQKRGWKTLARKLLIIASEEEYISRVKAEIVEYCTKEHAKFGPKPHTNRDRLRLYFNNMDEVKLQNACTKLSVSYASFMGSNDKVGLVEALCDEMESI